jgi:CubicO group peptidase (beta-lactamase class C family)
MPFEHNRSKGTISRRDFMATLGGAALGASLAGSLARAAAPTRIKTDRHADPFPHVAPAKVGVNEASLQEVVKFLDAQFKAAVFPGAAVVATRHGKTFIEQYWGTYCNHERRDNPYDGSVVNMLFSFSKLVSATVVVMAHQDGLIDYDVPVSTYIPEFVGGGKDKITIRHLLTHSAGIPTWGYHPENRVTAVNTEEKWKAAIKSLCAYPVEWEPGSKTIYHAVSGLLVAAEAVRRVSQNKPWNTICRERLFEPLGASSLSFEEPPEGTALALVPQPKELPSRYGLFGEALLGQPAGGCFGRFVDVLKILNLHVNRGVWRGKTLIKPDAFKEMHTVQYAREIEQAVAAGKASAHEPFGLGPLLRGTGPASPSLAWFGFVNQKGPHIFGHAGIDALIGVGDPDQDLAIIFMTTNSLKWPEQGTPEKVVPLRNGVTDRIYQALKPV